MVKPLNKLKWLGYPEGDLDSIVFVYFYKKWKVVPFKIIENSIIYDDKISIVSDGSSIVVVDGKITRDKNKKDKLVNDSGLELDLLSATIDGNRIRLYECYVATLDDSLKFFSDCIYLNTEGFDYEKTNSLCGKLFYHGVLFKSKNIDEKGNSKTKTTLIEGDFKSTINWFRKFSSAMSEKNGVVIPTSKEEWMKKYPETVFLKLTKN